jgi:hypothetical protein
VPIKVQCGNCGTKLKAPDSYAGRTSKCLKCGDKLLIKAVELPAVDEMELDHQCPFCKESIKQDAIKCRHCGEFLDGRSPEKWNPNIAGLLSFFIVGAGQIYKGDFQRGVAMFAISLVGGIALTGGGEIRNAVHALFIIVVAMFLLALWGFGLHDAINNKNTKAGLEFPAHLFR